MVFLDGEFIDKWTYLSTAETIIGKDSNISFDSNIFISSNILSNLTNGAILQNSLNKSMSNLKQTLLLISFSLGYSLKTTTKPHLLK